VRSISRQVGGEPLCDDRVHVPPGRERGPDLRLGHAARPQLAKLVLVEAEQNIAHARPQGPMEAPLEADSIGVGERVKEAAVDERLNRRRLVE
jgi:hypothetical protein